MAASTYPYSPSNPGKFAPFDIHDDVVFKVVNGLSLKATILVPRTVRRVTGNKCPLMVHWHGGGFTMGHRLYEPWFAKWILELAEEKGAIVVSPDYRLLPQVSMDELLDDVTDLWSWVQSDLQSELTKLAPEIEIDLDRIAVFGESAGGSLSVFSHLLRPDLNIKAIIATYGVYDRELYPIQGHKLEAGPASDKSTHGRIRLDSVPDFEIHAEYTASGRLYDAFGVNERVNILKLVEKAQSFPAVWLLHAKDDVLAKVEHTYNLREKIQSYQPDTPIHTTIVESGGHGFEADFSLSNEILPEGLNFVQAYWP